MTGTMAQMARMVALIMAVLWLAGCSSVELPYPKVSDFKRITRAILSPDEQQAAIEELTTEQEQHEKKAAEENHQQP